MGHPLVCGWLEKYDATLMDRETEEEIALVGGWLGKDDATLIDGDREEQAALVGGWLGKDDATAWITIAMVR
jgi:hypothetical protein